MLTRPSTMFMTHTVTMTWDFDNRLKEQSSSVIGSFHTATYDALGRRVSRNTGVTIPSEGYASGNVVYVSNGAREIAKYKQGDAASIPAQKFLYGSYVDEPVVMINLTAGINAPVAGTETLYYYHQNNLSSTAAMTDSTGTVVERYYYTAYGFPLVTDAAGTLLTTPYASTVLGNPWLYTGRRCDIDMLGLQYYRARYYDPQLGRFVNRDPIIYDDGPNMYAYVGGGPLGSVDPTGLETIGDKIASFFKNSSLRSLGAARSKTWTFSIPIPAIPGLSINFGLTASIDVERCCSSSGFETNYLHIRGIVEGYGSVGKSFRKYKPGKGGRNDPVPDPRGGNKSIKRKDARGLEDPDYGFRDRFGQVTVGPLDDCPKEFGWSVFEDANVFIRGSAGAYFGYQFNAERPIERDFDLFSGWSFEHGAAFGVYGVSVEAGVGASIGYTIKLDETRIPCCDQEKRSAQTTGRDLYIEAR